MMHVRNRSDAGDMSASGLGIASPRSRASSRAPSFSSDRGSVTSSATFQMPPPSIVRPAPAYIAASVASQIVTDSQNARLQEEALESDDFIVNALFSEQALSLLNAFLDHLLFAILSTARSPSLTTIRPAITEVLKPRLARDALATADEELEGLLAGEDEDEFPTQNGQVPHKWDIEKVWKRTRLRIMVYTRLGELEDEDEERYVQQERGLTMDRSDGDDEEEAGLVSWAAAIFLTSVIEHIAEQTLLLSGEAAFARTASKLKKLARQSLDNDAEELPMERLIVEEHDVEKLAVNASLGRLWRTWRKRVRSHANPTSPRGLRNISSINSLHRRKTSHDANELDEMVREMPEHEPTETDIAANIPLPMGDNDIDEIEVPGLARTFEEEESTGTPTLATNPRRPSSVIVLAPVESFRRRQTKDRPLSLPPPQVKPFVVNPRPEELEQDENVGGETWGVNHNGQKTKDPEDEVEMPFATAMERISHDGSYINVEHPESVHRDQKELEGEHEADADMVAFAASTGMGFGMGPSMGSSDPVKTTKKPVNNGSDTPNQSLHAEYPQAMHATAKRMSIQKTGSPGLVRTFSTRSSSLRSPSSTPQTTPKLEPGTFFDDSVGDDRMSGPEAIGVAHTSNHPIPTPSPPAEAGHREWSNKGKHPSHGGYVEVLPRQTAPTSIQVRDAPPESSRSPVENTIARKEVPRRDIPTSQPRTRDITPPATRGTPLPAVLETDGGSPEQTTSPIVPEKSSRRASPSRTSPKQVRSHELPAPSAIKTKNLETISRSRSGTVDGGPERSPLQRIPSSSSTNRSVGTSILHSGRDSNGSLDGRPRGLSGRMSEEDRQREFDSLVKGDETVKFTLTPQTVRDLDGIPVVQRTEPQSANSIHKSHKSSSSITVYPRVNADAENDFGSQHLPKRSASRSQGSATSSGNKMPMRKPLAREPRVQNESMQDFADFIRSTGPAPGEERTVKPFVPVMGTDLRSSNNSSVASLGGLGRKLSTRKASSSHSHSNSTVNEGPSAKPRVHMEPRSPAGMRSGNDDLIDFIRQGPPGPNNGQHRIPRAVAPFRTTVDSDQFDTMLDEHGTVESAYGSQVSTNSKLSNTTSNSRTDLLPKQKVVQPAYSNTPQKLTGSFSSPDEPVITKTRRRIKDPYAIDTDDEDEDLLTALPNNNSKSAPPSRDESMMDFLNSMEPPSNSKPEAFVLSPETIAAAKARAAKNNGGIHNPYSSPISLSNNTNKSSPSSRNPSKPPSAQPAIISSTIMSDAPRAHKPRLQARGAAMDPRLARTGTNDLADFLRNSGPPDEGRFGAGAPAPGTTIRRDEKEGKRSAAKFWRKKTYPDLP